MEELKEHRSDRAYGSARERIELAKACAVFRELKRELVCIDFGDQIELALDIVERHPEVAGQYRDGSPRCSSTSIRTRTWPRRG